MAKFNPARKTGPDTENLEGAPAYSESPKLEFVSLLLTSFVEDKFYESASAQTKRTVDLMNRIPDKEFLAKAALFARNEYGMRSISHVVASHLAETANGEEWPKRFYAKVARRPDDVTEIISRYAASYNRLPRQIPNALKKGLGMALTKFDEYQVAKYQGKSKSVSLVDAVNICHPKETDAIKALVTGTLKPADTWEVKMTQTKGDKQKKEQAWTDLVKSRKIGYFALLRNLRNILQQAPELVKDACELLCDRRMIKKSLVLPFRFLTAIEEIEKLSGPGVQIVLTHINEAIDISIDNIPEFPGRTLIAVDGSGSMSGRPMQIASVFAAALAKQNPDADMIIFSNRARYYNPRRGDSMLSIADRIKKKCEYQGTDFQCVFDTANQPYDRIIILSDMQAWVRAYGYRDSNPGPALRKYKQRFNCDPCVHSFDLNGYGSLQFPERNVYAYAGFSEKVFDVMKIIESDKEALLRKIEGVEIG